MCTGGHAAGRPSKTAWCTSAPISFILRALALAIVGSVFGHGLVARATPTVPLADKKLAVLEFSVAAGMQLQAAEQLAAECRGAVVDATRSEKLFVLTQQNMNEVVKATGGRCVEGECELETARNLAVDFFLTGNVTLVDGTLFLNLQAYETRTGKLLGQKRATATKESDLINLVRPTTGDLLKDAFGVKLERGGQRGPVEVGTFGDTAAHVDTSLDSDVVATFESVPPGATVRLDGELLCQAAPCKKRVQPGRHDVVFEKERYSASTLDATIGAGAVVKATLAPKFGYLSVETRPEGVAVRINGAGLVRTPVEDEEIDAGAVEVVIEDLCYVRKGERLSLAAGERRTVPLEAVPRLAGLRVDAEDDAGNAVEGDVLVDDRVAGPIGKTLKVSVCAKQASVRIGSALSTSTLKLEEGRVTVMAAGRRGWSITRVVSGNPIAAEALAATTEEVFHERLDAGLARAWAKGDRAAIVSAVDEVRSEKPRDPVALAWIAAVLDAEGLPETAHALAAAVDGVDAMAPAAASALREREKEARSLELSIGGSDDAPLSVDEHDGVRRALTDWVASWSSRPEPIPDGARSGALGAALAIVQRELGAVPEGRPRVVVNEGDGSEVLRVVAGAWRIPSTLDVDVGARREPLHVDASAVGDRHARIAVQLRPWARVVDEDLSKRFAAGDVAGVVDGVAALHARLPDEPLARDWLVAALGALGLPETATALHASGATSSSTTAAARAAAAVGASLRTTTLRIVAEPGASLSTGDRVDVDTAISHWLSGWATDEEKIRRDVIDVASRALGVVRAVAPDVGLRSAVVDKRVVDGGVEVTVRHGRARKATAFALHVDRFVDVDVDADAFAALSRSHTVHLVRAVRATVVAPEPDEQVTIDGRGFVVDARGRTSTTKLPHRVSIARTLGAMQRTDVVDIADGQTEVLLPSWPLLERAEGMLGGAWDGRPLSPDAVAVVEELCTTPAGRHGALLREATFAREGAFLELLATPASATFSVDGAPASVVHCDGRTWLSLGRDRDTVSLAMASGERGVVIDAAARQAGRLELEARVRLTSSITGLRWRGVDGEWRSLDEVVVVPSSVASMRVEVAAPRRTPVDVVVAPALGARVDHEVPIEATTAPLLPAWSAWQELQDTRASTWALAGIPTGLAVAAGGAAGVGAWFNADAQDARTAYNATSDLAAARVLRARAVGSVASANAWALGASVTGALSLASTAVPVVWAWVLHPDEPPPEDFPTTTTSATIAAWRAGRRQATAWQLASIPAALGLVAGGATAMGAWANGDAQAGLAAYDDAVDPEVAATQRSVVEGKLAVANAWAGTAIVSGVLAIASTALPLACALWPDSGEPAATTNAAETSSVGAVATAAEAR